MEGVRHVHRPVCSRNGLCQHLTAEDVFGLVVLTTIEIAFELLHVEDVEYVLQHRVHRFDRRGSCHENSTRLYRR